MHSHRARTLPPPTSCGPPPALSRVATAASFPPDRPSDRYGNIAAMPKLAVEGFATVEVENGKRLVLAIEQDAGVDILHACGGNARCTTCRVEFVSGEPQ